MITLEILKAVSPHARAERLELFLDPLNAALEEFEINTALREAAFLAQMSHECADFVHLRELADGRAYEGNAHLGNTEPGDGPLFRGWGLPQVTGRKNTRLASLALYEDERLIDDPSLIDPPSIELACRVGGWFWAVGAGLNLGRAAHAHGIQDGCNLNELADAGDFGGLTLAINGGLNGLDDRKARWQRAKGAIAGAA